MERPMWKPEHRQAANRSGLRYPSDLNDAEWVIVEPMIPPARHGGRKRSVNVREVTIRRRPRTGRIGDLSG
jgi:transposase